MASIFSYLTQRAFERDINTPNREPAPLKHVEKQEILSRPRQTPMRILPLGLCRTSETSLNEALKILGYHSFGMAEGTKSAKVVFGLWKEAVDAKYNLFPDANGGKPPSQKWSKKEFDGMLSTYDSVIGVPCCLFPEELISAYPDAKVILTTRSAKSWAETMRIAGGEMLTWTGIDFMIRWDTNFSGPLYNLIRSQMKVMCDTDDFRPNGHSAKFFEEHSKRVKALVPKERLLEFKVSDGWEPLCEFLECEVPDQPFPMIESDTDDEMIRKFQRSFWYVGMGRAVLKAGFVLMGLPALLAAGWIYQDTVLELTRLGFESLKELR